MYSADIQFLYLMRGQPRHNSPPHSQLPPTSFLGIGDLKTERSFDSQVSWVIDVLCLFSLTCYPWVFQYKEALADVLSTGAGIKYVCCTVCASALQGFRLLRPFCSSIEILMHYINNKKVIDKLQWHTYKDNNTLKSIIHNYSIHNHSTLRFYLCCLEMLVSMFYYPRHNFKLHSGFYMVNVNMTYANMT